MSDLTTADEPAVAETAVPAVDEALAQELGERARSEGVELAGPGGLLAGLTKTVLEVEMDEHLGYLKHAVSGCTRATRATAPGQKRC